MKKKILLIPLALLLASSLVITGCPAPASEPVVEPIIIRAVADAPISKPDNWAYREFIERFNKRAGGEAFIQYLGSEEVIPSYPQGKAVMDGTIDMSNIWSSAYASFFPAAVTMLLSKLTPVEERESGYYDYLAEGYREIGVVYLGRAVTKDPFYIFTNVKVEKTQDLAGLVITVGAPPWKPAIEFFGMSISTISDTEIYTGLATGVIDAAFDPTSSAFFYSYYEVIKYLVNHPVAVSGNSMTAINVDTWNKLSPEIQELMMATAIEVEAEMISHYADAGENIKQQLVENGIELIYLEDGDVFVDGFYGAMWGNIEGVSPEEILELKGMVGY